PLPYHVARIEWCPVRHSKSGCAMSALGQKPTYAVQKVMSALPPKADMCSTVADVRYGPKADIAPYSITSSAVASRAEGIVTPSAFAVLRLMTSSNLVGCCTGSSPGFAPLSTRSTYVAAR